MPLSVPIIGTVFVITGLLFTANFFRADKARFLNRIRGAVSSGGKDSTVLEDAVCDCKLRESCNTLRNPRSIQRCGNGEDALLEMICCPIQIEFQDNTTNLRNNSNSSSRTS